MKLHSRLLMVFGRNFCEKRQIWVCEPRFGEVRGDARPSLIARWKVHGRLSIHLNWTFFAFCYGSWIMRRNVYSSAILTGGWPLCTQISPKQGRPPSTIFGVRTLERMG